MSNEHRCYWHRPDRMDSEVVGTELDRILDEFLVFMDELRDLLVPGNLKDAKVYDEFLRERQVDLQTKKAQYMATTGWTFDEFFENDDPCTCPVPKW